MVDSASTVEAAPSPWLRRPHIACSREAGMDTRQDTLDLLRSRQKYFSLPQPFYNSRAIFDLDLSAIFQTHWIFAGMSSELATPGSYLTLNIGRSSIVVLRDHDGEIRAFYNTCR